MTKKVISIAILTGLISLSSPAYAAWQQDVQAAINSGNIAKIDVIAANNPNDQGALAILLLEQAQKKLKTNPELAAKIFAAAGPFVNQIKDPENNKAATILMDIVTTAKDGDFQQKNCVGALTILGAALSMSSLPNISVAAPNLHAVTLAAANDSLESKPLCDTKTLKDQVDLAEQPGTRPFVQPPGAHGPNNNPNGGPGDKDPPPQIPSAD